MMMFSEQLQAALDLLGPNGEYWTKGEFHRNNKYCASGAVLQIDDDAYNKFVDAVCKETQMFPSGINDLPSTTFDDVKELFVKVIEKAKKEEAVV